MNRTMDNLREGQKRGRIGMKPRCSVGLWCASRRIRSGWRSGRLREWTSRSAKQYSEL